MSTIELYIRLESLGQVTCPGQVTCLPAVKKMGRTEWAMWANEHALLSGVVLTLGGVVGTAAQFPNWQFAAASLGAGLLVMLIEYPRGKKMNGGFHPRRGQGCPQACTVILGPITRNYICRSLLLALLSAPGYLTLATILGSISLAISVLFYLLAAIRGESWQPGHTGDSKHEKISQDTEPKIPPPRTPEELRQGSLLQRLQLGRVSKLIASSGSRRPGKRQVPLTETSPLVES
uniref:Cytochrome b-245 light chain n=1 Tax=Eptatretus burgeri TaxID=7764 RepID=A0A8C4NJA8_EPTBU